MSGDEDTELRDLVAQTLENNGVLSKIRAELRASVYLAFDEHDPAQPQHKFVNKKLNSFMKSSDGMIAMSLVKEFLQFFNLDFTLSVFEPESLCGADANITSRHDLLKQLELNEPEESSNRPVLSLLLERSLPDENNRLAETKSNKIDSTSDQARNGTGEPVKTSVLEDIQKPKTKAVLNGKSISAVAAAAECLTEIKPAVPLEKQSPADLKQVPHKLTPQDEAKNINSLTQTIQNLGVPNLNAQSRNKSPESSPLGLLPPLLGGHSTSNDKSLEHIKAILEQDRSPEDSLDIYEEDFQSSVSGSQADQCEQKVGGPASGTEEIAEEVASDAPSSDSTVDGDQEVTLEESVTNSLGILADHLESV